MLMNIPVLISADSEHLGRYAESVKLVNDLQRSFRLALREVDWLPRGPQKVSVREVLADVEGHCPGERVIAIIDTLFRDDYFSHEYTRSHIVTAADWESTFAPPPMKVYLAFQYAGAMLNFAADLPQVMMDNWWHEAPIGCFFDFCEEKHTIRLSMIGANICGDCEVKLAGMGLPEEARTAVEQVLAYVRSASIRRPRAMPSHVFIGHGRADAWLELKSYLTDDLGLTIEEFNQEPTAGVTTTERLQEMLNRSCFAFLVMTAEDERAGRKLHARENVVHEIGLFQGRLGLKKAIILKENRCERFSNIDGLTYIEFKKGRLGEKRGQIREALEREGVVAPEPDGAVAPPRRPKRR